MVKPALCHTRLSLPLPIDRQTFPVHPAARHWYATDRCASFTSMGHTTDTCILEHGIKTQEDGQEELDQ